MINQSIHLYIYLIIPYNPSIYLINFIIFKSFSSLLFLHLQIYSMCEPFIKLFGYFLFTITISQQLLFVNNMHDWTFICYSCILILLNCLCFLLLCCLLVKALFLFYIQKNTYYGKRYKYQQSQSWITEASFFLRQSLFNTYFLFLFKKIPCVGDTL